MRTTVNTRRRPIRITTDCISPSCSDRRWGSYRITYTYSKALDNVGKFFFSSPIDNFNIGQGYARSDDDQRQRLVFYGNIHSPTGKANTIWDHIAHDFQLSAMLQYYSALPFNITAGAKTIQGTAARPTSNGAYISRNAGTGFDFLNLNVCVSRSFPIRERVRLEGIAEAFNLLNHTNGVTLNGTSGSGAYPTNPLPTFKQITAVADPRTLQLAVRLLWNEVDGLGIQPEQLVTLTIECEHL
jgi:hypothetical protein